MTRRKPRKRKPGDLRGTAAWQRLSARVCREEPICWLRLPGCTVRSTTGDHVIPVDERPDLCLVRANVRGACSSCNSKRGSRPLDQLRPATRAPALDWFDDE